MKKNYAGLKSLWGTACVLMCLMVSYGVWGQVYTTGANNWNNVWTQNSGRFDFTNGIGQFSFGSISEGQVDGRFFTTDGTFGGTQRTVKPGQRIRIRIAGQDGGGRSGIVTDGIIGVSIKSGGGMFDGTGPAGRYDNNSILKIEFVGGQSTARFTDGSSFSTSFMPNFSNFKSGTTYDIEVISDREFNLVIGANRNNIRSFAGSTSVSPALIHVRNTGANMDGLFTLLEVSNLPVNLTANGSESFTVTGVISNNESTANTVEKNGTGTVVLSNQNTYTGLTTINAGTLQLNRTGGTTIPNTNSVTVSGGTLRVSQNQTLSNLTLTSGGLTIDSGATLTLTGNVTIPNGFTITNNGTLVIEGALTDNRATKSFGGTVRFAASSGSQSVVGATYNNLELNGNSTKNLSANATINGNLTINAGTLNLGAFTMNRTSSGGTLTLGANTTLTIGGTNSFPTNYDTHSIATSSTVNYNGTDQVVALLSSSQSYGNLILSGTGDKSFGGNIVTENLTNGANANTLVASGQNIRVKSVLTNQGEFTIQNNANLIQEGSTNNNVGAITVQRNSSPLWRLDYTLWSAPVAGQNLLAFSPLTVANRFYVYNPTTNQYNTITPSTNAFQTGVGYLIRMPDNHVSNINNNPAAIWEGEFLGVPNNGDVTLTVANNTFNAVGNPYPSTISASAFYAANSLTQPLYFWRKINGAAGSAYATWTTAGGASSGSDATIPNGIIQVGQGFILRSTSTSVVFNNTMRVGNNANQFLRMADIEHNRVRVAMTGPNNFSQNILINYMSGATNEVDPAIDGKYINDSETAFYTLLDEEAYVIQGRTLPFDPNDVVPLGFKTTQSGNYQISLVSTDGLFADNQSIFLEDFTTGMTHDFANGAYTFTSATGVFHNRFQLKYVNQPLSVDQVGLNSLVSWVQDHTLYLYNSGETLSEVTIFDLMGRKISSFTQLESNTFNTPLQHLSNQVLLVQIKTSSGVTAAQKIIR